MARHRFVANDRLGRRSKPADVVAELRDAAGVPGGAALRQQPDATQSWKGGESLEDDRLEGIQLGAGPGARAIAGANALDGLVEEPGLDPAVHRRSADAGTTGRLRA